MRMNPEHRHLIKFLLASPLFLFVGTTQGVIQVLPPIRAWLDSVGGALAPPGRWIDPLAHAHINLVGGVVLISMAMTYYLLHQVSGRPVWSLRLVDHSFWWTAAGVVMFYSTLIFFGITEGRLLLSNPGVIPDTRQYYAPVISVVASVMAVGFWVFFINVFLTVRAIFRRNDG